MPPTASLMDCSRTSLVTESSLAIASLNDDDEKVAKKSSLSSIWKSCTWWGSNSRAIVGNNTTNKDVPKIEWNGLDEYHSKDITYFVLLPQTWKWLKMLSKPHPSPTTLLQKYLQWFSGTSWQHILLVQESISWSIEQVQHCQILMK